MKQKKPVFFWENPSRELRAVWRIEEDASMSGVIAADARDSARELRKIARRLSRKKYDGVRVGAMAADAVEAFATAADYSARLARALRAEARRRDREIRRSK